MLWKESNFARDYVEDKDLYIQQDVRGLQKMNPCYCDHI